jgi:hypothetical protein
MRSVFRIRSTHGHPPPPQSRSGCKGWLSDIRTPPAGHGRSTLDSRALRKAVRGDDRTAIGMDVVVVCAVPDGIIELCKRSASLRQTTPVGGQVGGDDRWGRRRADRTKISAASQVGRGIDLLGLTKKWVVAAGEFGRRASAVATIALAHGVDEITPKNPSAHAGVKSVSSLAGALPSSTNVWNIAGQEDIGPAARTKCAVAALHRELAFQHPE